MRLAQPKYEYACFISYRHPPNQYEKHFYNEFVEALEDGLKSFLTTSLLPYRDDQLGFNPGVAYPQELSRKLCRSVCLVAVLTPDYPDSNWCRGEWQAMEKLETNRLGVGRKGLIVPIILRGNLEEWRSFVGDRVWVDLRLVQKPREQLDSVKNRRKIEDIAQQISKFVQTLLDPCEDCDQFQICLGPEQRKSIPTLKDPDPLSR